MDALLDVIEFYPKRMNAKRVGTPDEIAIFKTLPEFFKLILGERYEEFKIYGSIGQGNLSVIPWVAILHKELTLSTQNAFYIVLLFSADMSECYLSLNQGVTSFQKKFNNKKKVIWGELKKMAKTYQDLLPKPIFGNINELDLKTKSTLGMFYGAGNIQSFVYSKDNLPSDEKLKKDFLILLS